MMGVRSVKDVDGDHVRHTWLMLMLIPICRCNGGDAFTIPQDLQRWQATRGVESDMAIDAVSNVNSLFKSKFMFEDGKPAVYHNSETNKTVIVCLNQKVGSTTWKLALLKSLSGKGGFRVVPNLFSDRLGGRWGPHTAFKLDDVPPWWPALDDALRDPAIPRIMFVRNPYTRFFSYFVDKELKRKRYNSGMVPPKDFRSFVDRLDALAPEALRSTIMDNAHRSPLSTHCGLPNDLKYDMYLKVEDLSVWYEPFVRLLNIEDSMQTGWNFATKWYNNSRAGDCFFVKPFCSCARMFTEDCHDISHHGSESEFKKFLPQSHHATGKMLSWTEEYNVKTAAFVTTHFASDLKEFGYKPWFGNSTP